MPYVRRGQHIGSAAKKNVKTFFILFGIQDHHAVELTERSPNPPSNSKKVKLVTGNSIFRSHVDVAEARDACRGPPRRGRSASAPDLATAFDLCAAASLLRARQASQEPARPRRAAKHATCPCARAPASSKVGSARTARRRASCPLNGPPRHRPAFRWRLRRAGPRQPASGEDWGGRAGSSSVHVRREGRPAATPLRGSPAATAVNGRARRPLNGPAAPAVGLGLRLRRPRPHRPGSGEGRGGRAG